MYSQSDNIKKLTVVVDREGHVRHLRPRLLQGQGRLSDDPRHLFIHVFESFFKETNLLSFYPIVNLYDIDGHFFSLTLIINQVVLF